MNRKKAYLIIAAIIALTGLRTTAEARYNARHVWWEIEEYDGRKWRELPASRDDYNRYPGGDSWDDERSWGSDYETSTSRFSISPTMGRKYRVRVSNMTFCKMAVTLDVDGKNSIDSENISGTSNDAAWVVNRLSTLNVSGFQASSKTAMEFYWTDREDAHSDLESELGAIKIYVYFENGSCARNALSGRGNDEDGRSLSRQSPGGTGAGEEIYNPVRTVNFDSLTRYPIEVVTINYDRGHRDYDDWDHGDWDRDRHSSCFTGIGVRGYSTGYSGVKVDSVLKHKPAWAAGIRAGDIIVKVGGRNVNSISEMSNILRSLLPDHYVVVKYLSNGKKRSAGMRVETICER